MAFFILKLDKGTSYLHSKASLSFYGPFLVSHSVTNAIYCPLNHLTFSNSLSNSLLPGKGRVSNSRGMPGMGGDAEVTNNNY